MNGNGHSRLEVKASRADRDGKRLVIAFYDDGAIHRDRFDTDSDFLRSKFKDAIFKILRAAAPLGTLDADIIQAAERADQEPDQSPIGKPRIVMMDTVAPRPIRWVWQGRIAIGKYTHICGDPGLGKSLMIADLAARITQGLPWPDGTDPCEPGSVVVLTAEDSLDDTLRPRLDAAGADASKVAAIVGVQWYDTETAEETVKSFNLVEDLSALEQTITSLEDCRAAFIDPISAYLKGTDSHRNSDVRAVLAPVAEMAERLGVAIVGIDHLNKAGSGPAMYRSMGSLAFVAAARCVWGVVRDKQDRQRRLFLPVKNNLAPDTTGLSYAVVERDGVPVLAWSADPVVTDVDEAMSSDRDEESGERAAIVEWLKVVLANGAIQSDEMEKLAKAAGHAWRTVKKHKKAAGVESYHEGFGKGSTWWWKLKEDIEDTIGAQDKTLAPYAPFDEDLAPYGTWDEGSERVSRSFE